VETPSLGNEDGDMAQEQPRKKWTPSGTTRRWSRPRLAAWSELNSGPTPHIGQRIAGQLSYDVESVRN